MSDWRGELKRNARKTRCVVVTFIAIYIMVGLLADTMILLNHYPQATITQCLYALVTFQILPLATLIMLGISLVSLLITYAFYDRMMLLGTEYWEVTPKSARNLMEKQLFNVVDEMRVAAGLAFMPKVFLIEANYMNAFASGYSEKSAMVAITRGLIEKLDRAELQAVMAHELSHIRHQDIKLTLTVAVLSNIILMMLDMLFYSMLFKRERREDNRLLLVIMVLRYALPLITVILTLFLSRTREYMADAGCVELMRDNEPLARALRKIHDDHVTHAQQYVHEYGQTPHEQVRQASYLFDPSTIDPVKSLTNLFSTHPSLDARLKALGVKKSQ